MQAGTPDHSPFGFGGNSPRDIQMLVGFRKPLPRNGGPAAVYLRRRKARGLTGQQLLELEQQEEQAEQEQEIEEDEFTRQLRQHAERRRRKMQLKAEQVHFLCPFVCMGLRFLWLLFFRIPTLEYIVTVLHFIDQLL